MRKTVWLLGLCGVLAGCGQLGLFPAEERAESQTQTRPQSRPEAVRTEALRPPTTARSVEEFDTATAEERIAAAAPADTGSERLLGATIVSLGNPAQPGFWLETPLVTVAAKGRVVYPGTGETAQVDLIPIADGGSRISLSAMRLLGVPLTDLVEVQVFSGG